MPVTPWHTITAEETARLLNADPASGLPAEEVERRLAEHGPNRLEEKKRTPPWRIFLAQYQDFMIYVLVGAVVVSAIEGQVPEAIAILTILILNGVLGFVQEYRAERSLDALQEMSAPTATVIRGGIEQEVEAVGLVPGDLVLLEAGDRVPADGRLTEAVALRMVESALTGESQPSRKHAGTPAPAESALGDRADMVYAGTSVAVGRGRYLVTSTGQGTEMGRIATLLASTEEAETPLSTELEVVGKRIAIIVLAVAAVVFVEEVLLELRHEELGLLAAFEHPSFRTSLTEALLIAVSLAVAAIPEGLPAVVTVALSLGVRRMASHHAIVRKLHAVETLGSTTFICSDKTGTLTMNRMTVRRLVVGEDAVSVTADWGIEPAQKSPAEQDLELLLRIAAACNDAHYASDGALVGDPTETALVDLTQRLSPGHLRPRRVGEIPFDSERKRMTTVHEIEESRVAYVKGGADVVLDLCTRAVLRGETVDMTEALRGSLSERNVELASSGYRTLAVAFRELEISESDNDDLEHDLTYVGILGLVDPAREEVPASIAECHRAGIQVAMVTGDYALTARAIAEQVGLSDFDSVIDGVELAAMSDEELCQRVKTIRVYARVNPEDKLRIVAALKANGEVVAMTGDGVNDAPALKRADIGIAMGLVGTDVSREAADMILTDDNFATIVEAVREGRIVFANLRKVILFLLSCNMSEVLIVFITALLSPTPALYPLQLLWINLVTDGPPALALGSDAGSPRIMEHPPRNANEPILTKSRQIEILIQGALMTFAGLIIFVGGEHDLFTVDSHAHLNTMLFTAMVLVQKIHAFSYLSESRSIFSLESLRNRWLNLAFVATVAMQAGVVYWAPAQRLFKTAPLGLHDWIAVVIAVLVPVFFIDRVKLAFTRRRAREEAVSAASEIQS